MNEVIRFDFNGSEVRTVVIDGTPLFCGKDVCSVLGYKNESDAMNRHCKGVVNRYPLMTAGGMQDVRFLNQSDTIRLIINSDLPSAIAFEKELMEVIIPSIMNHGGYLTPSAVEQALTDPDFIIRLATQLKEEREKRLWTEAKNKELSTTIEKQKPAMIFADAVSASVDSIRPVAA